jgi:GcrA cell cycle regulator
MVDDGKNSRFWSEWTPEAEATVRRLWPKMSASNIAKELAKDKFTTTKNAVIARARKLQLEKKVKPARTEQPRALPEGAKLRRVRIQTGRRHSGYEKQVVSYYAFKDSDAPSSTACTILELSDSKCRWPIGEVGEKGFCYCGDLVRVPPYCDKHRRKAHGQ